MLNPMRRRQNRDRKINYLVPSSDNIWVDTIISNTNTNVSGGTSYYSIKRHIDILPKSTDYYISIDELRIPNDFIPRYILYGRNPKEQGYEEGDLDYWIEFKALNTEAPPDGYGSNVVSKFYLNIGDVDSGNAISPRIFTVQFPGEEDKRIIAIFYTALDLVYFINNNLAEICEDYANKLYAQINNVYWEFESTPQSVYVKFEIFENKLRFMVNRGLLGNQTPVILPDPNGTNPPGPNTQINFSDTFWYLLMNGFTGFSDVTQENTRIQYSFGFEIGQYRANSINIASVGAPQESTLGYGDTASVIANLYISSLFISDSQKIPKILCEVGIIPSQANINGNDISLTEKYLLTFIPDQEQLEYSNYVFKPLNASKFVDLLSETELNELSFKFYYIDFLGNKYEIFIPLYKSIDIRLLCTKKQLINNYYRSDEPV